MMMMTRFCSFCHWCQHTHTHTQSTSTFIFYTSEPGGRARQCQCSFYTSGTQLITIYVI
jgi:hypothetical protein